MGFFLWPATPRLLVINYSPIVKAAPSTLCILFFSRSSPFFFNEVMGVFSWTAVVVALAGLYLLCMQDGFSLDKGDILLLCCAILFAFQILAVDHYSPLVSGVKLSMMQFLICGIGSGIPALLFEHPEISQILAAWKPVLYAGVLSCGVAYTLQIIGQRDLNPTIASLIMSLESCISVLAGWMILHQTLSLREITGCAVMFAAIILAQLPSSSR